MSGVLIYPKGMSVRIGRCSHDLCPEIWQNLPHLVIAESVIDRDVMRSGDDVEITVRNSTNLTVVPVR